MHLPVLRRSLLVLSGRSPGLEVADYSASPLHLPRPSAEWYFEAASSLTVAEPRRLFTGLPRYAHMGT